jgi:hypothetical protein
MIGKNKNGMIYHTFFRRNFADKRLFFDIITATTSHMMVSKTLMKRGLRRRDLSFILG